MKSQDQIDNEEIRLMKQNFLKEKILDDPRYDANEFVEFMRIAKPNVEGGDINNWEYDELINQVQDFKSMKQQLESNSIKSFIIKKIYKMFKNLKIRTNSTRFKRIKCGRNLR